MENQFKQYFILFANCKAVKGATRSLIADLQLGKFFYIPNDLYHILEQVKDTPLTSIYAQYSAENQEIVREYFKFLIDNGLGFINDEIDVFPELSLEWDFPAKVSNSILDIDANSIQTIDYKKVFADLSALNCFCVEIRIFEVISLDALKELLDFTLDTRLKDIRLVLKFESALKQALVETIFEKHQRIRQVIFYDCESNFATSERGVNLIFLKKEHLNAMDCGAICSDAFSIGIYHYTEAMNFNSCLNRKISLDHLGNIKNCPSQSISFGNIKNTSFLEVIEQKEFQRLGEIKKDDIKVCKDCEHRYICVDCRIFLENENDVFSKPLKCTYDPYSATWK